MTRQRVALAFCSAVIFAAFGCREILGID